MKFLKQNFPSWFKVNSKNSLSSLYPTLAAEFIKIKNGCFTVDNVSSEINKNHKETQKFWWKCNCKQEDHIYQATIWSRVYNLKNKKESCPMCKGQVVVRSNSLAFLEPNIAKYWDYELNGNYNPKNIWFNDSSKKFYWICEKSKHHKPKATVSLRKEKPNCEYCDKSLITLRPKIESFYNQSLNNGISPYDILFSPTRYGNEDWSVIGMPNKKEFTWVCDKQHSWQSSIKSKLIHFQLIGSKANCPHCKNISESLKSINPELAKYWHPTKNNIQPTEIKPGSNKEIWWMCKEKQHVWIEAISKISKRKNYCQKCKNDSNTLSNKYPDIAKQWHPSRNKNYRFNGITLTAKNTSSGYSQNIWWRCNKNPNHEWKATVRSRTRGSKCPLCTANNLPKIIPITITNPSLTGLWHDKKNGELRPSMFEKNNAKTVWWKCKENGHIWKESISRISKREASCPKCEEKLNLLINNNRKIAKEWHPSKNKLKSNGKVMTVHNTTITNPTKFWWKCNKGDNHEWKATIKSRINGINNCILCELSQNKKNEIEKLISNDLIFEASQLYLELAFENGQKKTSKIMIEFEKLVEINRTK